MGEVCGCWSRGSKGGGRGEVGEVSIVQRKRDLAQRVHFHLYTWRAEAESNLAMTAACKAPKSRLSWAGNRVMDSQMASNVAVQIDSSRWHPLATSLGSPLRTRSGSTSQLSRESKIDSMIPPSVSAR